MNPLRNSMISVLRKKFLEVFMVMVSTNHLQFSKKVFYQLFKVTILLLKLNLVQVKLVLSPLLLFKPLIPLRLIFKLLLLHQQESFLFKVLLSSSLLVNIKESKSTHVQEELVLERTSKLLNLVLTSLLELQEESTT